MYMYGISMFMIFAGFYHRAKLAKEKQKREQVEKEREALEEKIRMQKEEDKKTKDGKKNTMFM